MTTLDKMLQGLANALGASLSTLTTTAKTVVGAINELKSGLTSTTNTVSSHTSVIGSGSLDTTSQTLISAINELAAQIPSTLGTSHIKFANGLLIHWGSCTASSSVTGTEVSLSPAFVNTNYKVLATVAATSENQLSNWSTLYTPMIWVTSSSTFRIKQYSGALCHYIAIGKWK